MMRSGVMLRGFLPKTPTPTQFMKLQKPLSAHMPIRGTFAQCVYSTTVPIHQEQERNSDAPAPFPSNLVLDDPSVLDRTRQEVQEIPNYTKMEIQPPVDYDTTLPVYNFRSGEKTGDTVELDRRIGDTPFRRDIIHRVVLWQQANRRTKYFKTKHRSEDSGSGRKLRPQKGMGMARVGEARVPGRKGGPKAHGPVIRDWDFSLPKKVRRLALRSALNTKLWQGELKIVDNLHTESAKTRDVKPVLSEWDILQQNKENKTLLVDSAVDGENPLVFAINNLKHIDVMKQAKSLRLQQLNVLDMLKVKNVIITKQAFDELQQRITRFC